MLVEPRIEAGLHRLVCQAWSAAQSPFRGSTVEVA